MNSAFDQADPFRPSPQPIRVNFPSGKCRIGLSLNIAVAYEDEATREWANQTTEQITVLVGASCARIAWWSAGQLNNPSVRSEAVRSAGLADILIVSIRAAARVSAGLHAWIVWGLASRSRPEGLLVAQLGTGALPGVPSVHVRSYSEALARANGLDFLPCERELAAAVPRPLWRPGERAA